MRLGRAARLAALLVLANAAIGVWAWQRLPAAIAVAFGPDGLPHAWAPKPLGLSILPATAALVTLGVGLAVSTLPGGEGRARSGGPFGLLVAPAALLLVAQAGLVARALDPAFDWARWLFLALAVLLTLTGASLGRLRRNHLMGVRTRWTLADAGVWTRTQRLTGRLMVASAVALAAAVAFLPDRPLMIALLILGAVGAPVAGAVYSARPGRTG